MFKSKPSKLRTDLKTRACHSEKYSYGKLITWLKKEADAGKTRTKILADDVKVYDMVALKEEGIDVEFVIAEVDNEKDYYVVNWNIR